MAFPSFKSTATTLITPNSSSWVISLPAQVASGDLLIVFMAIDNTPTVTWDTTSHGTWTLLSDLVYSTLVRGVAYAKIADGTEAGSTITNTLSAGDEGVGYAISIRDWKGALNAVTSSANSGSSRDPTPVQVIAAGGSGDNLFIALSAGEGTALYTTFPTNYVDNNYTVQGGDASGAAFGIASREYVSASDTPSAFSRADWEGWVCVTIVVEPAAPTGDVSIIVPSGPWR